MSIVSLLVLVFLSGDPVTIVRDKMKDVRSSAVLPGDDLKALTTFIQDCKIEQGIEVDDYLKAIINSRSARKVYAVHKEIPNPKNLNYLNCAIVLWCALEKKESIDLVIGPGDDRAAYLRDLISKYEKIWKYKIAFTLGGHGGTILVIDSDGRIRGTINLITP